MAQVDTGGGGAPEGGGGAQPAAGVTQQGVPAEGTPPTGVQPAGQPQEGAGQAPQQPAPAEQQQPEPAEQPAAGAQPSAAGAAGGQPPIEIPQNVQKTVVRVVQRRHRMSRTEIIGGLLVLALLAYFVGLPFYEGFTSTTTTIVPGSTTVSQVGYLSGCQTISTHGSYYLSGTIKYSSASGACMDITSNSVSIICDGKGIVGSGPYVDVPPFSYGIRAAGVKNLTVSGCAVSNFSYGVLMRSVRGFSVLNSNITTNFMSDLYLSNSSNGTVTNDYISGSGSAQGAVLVTNGSAGNRFANDTLKDNPVYGFNINASGNTYLGDYVSGSKMSFVCTPRNGFPHSSVARANVCYNETGCGFVSCTGNNIPLDITKIVVGKSVGTCGVITSTGSYALAGNLAFGNYSSQSAGALKANSTACLRISAPGVTLNCGNHAISGGYIGVRVLSSNVTVTNCTVSGTGIGILMANTTGSVVARSNFTGDDTSIYLLNSSVATISNVKANGGGYGVQLISSPLNLVKNFTANNNTYGLYLSNSLGNTFVNGSAQGNSQFDVYGFGAAANQSSNLMSGTKCGLTNTQWATCTQRTKNSTSSFFPISSCMSISKPGKYVLAQPLQAASPNCIQINTNNTSLDCQNLAINANPGTLGAGVWIRGRRNVTVNDCPIINYNAAVVVNNSAQVDVNGINGRTLAFFGIEFNNVTNSTISNSALRGPSNDTVLLNHVRGTTVSYNNVSYTVGRGVGILVLNSTGNKVYNNTGRANYVSLYLKGLSLNNTIVNNTFTTSATADYQCDQQDGPLNVEYGGINYGGSKSGCHWLAMLPPYSKPLDCPAFTASGLYSMTSDAAYYGGVICLSLLANYSVVNCNGHTVLAVNGGTFARFLNSNASEIENCYLKGFTNPILATGSAVTVFNNTIYSSSLLNSSAAAINITKAQNTRVMDNHIVTPYIGIREGGVIESSLMNNNVLSPGGTAYQLNTFSYSNIYNNTAWPGTGFGMTLTNSILDHLQNNDLNGVSGGIACIGTAQPVANNTDQGGNYCSSATQCAWLGPSKATC